MMLRVDSCTTDLKAIMVMRLCVMIGNIMTYILQKCTRKGREEKEEEEQYSREESEIKTDRRSQETITVSRQRKQKRVSQEDIYGRHNLIIMHLDISQPSTCSSSRLTVASFEVKLQFVKVPLLPLFLM